MVGLSIKIIRNIKYFLSKGVFVRVRINIDEDNIDELDKLDSYLKKINCMTLKGFLYMLLIFQEI